MGSYWLVMLAVYLCGRSSISASGESQLSEKSSEIVGNTTTENLISSKQAKEVISLGAETKTENPIGSKPAKEVITLGTETFSNHVRQGNHFVLFYAPWCAHSFRLQSTWNKLAESPDFDGKVTIARLDCESNKEICKDYEIKGYPTLLWIKNAVKVKQYSEERNYVHLSSFIREMIDQTAE
ncbi:hypothetical protein Trydic_g22485 [Trypoxylus dichotomus]